VPFQPLSQAFQECSDLLVVLSELLLEPHHLVGVRLGGVHDDFLQVLERLKLHQLLDDGFPPLPE